MPPIPRGSPEPTHAQWLQVRSLWTAQAAENGDVEALKKISTLPGGFGGDSDRRKAWAVLLPTKYLSSESSSRSEDPRAVHKDETQVKLDTVRSFVTFPKDIIPENKQDMQDDLQDLIVGVLRKYPQLSYFQGYHDILSVLYLTFIPLKEPPVSRSRSVSSRRSRSRPRSSGPTMTEKSSQDGIPEPPVVKVVHEKVQRADSCRRRDVNQAISDRETKSDRRDTQEWKELRKCAEAVSLYRVRDAMGSGMEGMMGLLKILKRLLLAADPNLSRFSAQISPVPTLPFFALSWVLTLFSHDCDEAEPVKRIFDYMLGRNPVAAVYLAAAILIRKKPQMFALAKQLGSEYVEDPTLLHPLFVRLPPLYPDTPSSPVPHSAPVKMSKWDITDPDSPNPYTPILLSELFVMTDMLMEKYRWDGDVIRGQEVMGPGSAVMTYAREEDKDSGVWTAEDTLKCVDVDVVLPGVMDLDPEPEPPIFRLPSSRLRILKIVSKKQTLFALGVMILGIGVAVYGVKSGGNHSSWGRWGRAVWRSVVEHGLDLV